MTTAEDNAGSVTRRSFVQLMVASALTATPGFVGAAHAADDLVQKVSDLVWVPDGPNGAKHAYVIFAPWCPQCKAFYHASRQLVQSIQLRWVPAGIRDARSRANNAALTSTRDPRKLYELCATGNISGAAEYPTAAADLNQSILVPLGHELSSFLRGSYAFPTALFRSTNGIEAVVGPDNASFSRIVATVPYQPRSDVWLKRQIFVRERLDANMLAAARTRSAIYALPFLDVPIVRELEPGRGYHAEARIVADGRGWIAIRFHSYGGWAYVPESDVVLRTV